MWLVNMNVFEIIQLGRKYKSLWPQRAELGQYFEEYQSVQVARFVCKYFGYLAVVVFILQLYMGSLEALPQALFYALFIATMPVQALIMLGVKADKFLPPALANWYKEGVAKINQGGGDIKLSTSKPRYLDLAKLLKVTYSNHR